MRGPRRESGGAVAKIPWLDDATTTATGKAKGKPLAAGDDDAAAAAAAGGSDDATATTSTTTPAAQRSAACGHAPPAKAWTWAEVSPRSSSRRHGMAAARTDRYRRTDLPRLLHRSLPCPLVASPPVGLGRVLYGPEAWAEESAGSSLSSGRTDAPI